VTTRSVAYVCIAVALTASAPAQQPPPVRPLGPIVNVSMEPLRSVAAVRHLPDGRVFVNDIIAHRLMLFDSSLVKASVVADSTNATGMTYGARPGGLIAYHADSTLLADPTSGSMLVIDPTGRVSRIIPAPRPTDMQYLVGGPYGAAGFDSQGRLVYSTRESPRFRAPADSGRAVTDFPDSAFVVRTDLTSTRVDTLGVLKIPKSAISAVQDAKGNITGIRSLTNPLPLLDDWAVESDGSVAFVRGRDYHVDWLSAGGAWTSSPKMPFDWEHLNAYQKTAVIDSVTVRAQARLDSMQAALDKGTIVPMPTPDASGTISSGTTGGVFVPLEMPAAGRSRGASSGSEQANRLPPPLFVEPKDLPDYKPPFLAGAIHVDTDGNLWIRTTKITNGRAIYDIVNRQGHLVDRVQLPAFRIIAGFGPGVVYMGVRDSTGVVHVERARIK
jgi:hypothetical protein